LQSDNTDGGAVMMRPTRFLVVAVWIANGLSCIYICIYIARQKIVRLYTLLRLSKFRLEPDLLLERNDCVQKVNACASSWRNAHLSNFTLSSIAVTPLHQRGVLF